MNLQNGATSTRGADQRNTTLGVSLDGNTWIRAIKVGLLDVGDSASVAVNVESIAVARHGEGQWRALHVGVADVYLLQLRIQAGSNWSESAEVSG